MVTNSASLISSGKWFQIWDMTIKATTLFFLLMCSTRTFEWIAKFLLICIVWGFLAFHSLSLKLFFCCFLVLIFNAALLLLHTGISYIAPHLNNLYFLTLCQRYGVYQVIRWLFMLKLGLSVAMLLAGADHIYLLCVFIARYGRAHTSAHASWMCGSLAGSFCACF